MVSGSVRRISQGFRNGYSHDVATWRTLNGIGEVDRHGKGGGLPGHGDYKTTSNSYWNALKTGGGVKCLNPTGNAPLRQRIEAFSLDEEGAALPFTSRLAREQAWTHAFAARVVREYKRFLLLAMEAGHPVTPPEAVDQAWHLHLVYTKSYWQELCGRVLGRELHHEPTGGGPAEQAKFKDWYGATLESYRRLFGEEPPPAIWPDPGSRFAHAGAGRWVDTARYWLLPRPPWTHRRWWKGRFKPNS